MICLGLITLLAAVPISSGALGKALSSLSIPLGEFGWHKALPGPQMLSRTYLHSGKVADPHSNAWLLHMADNGEEGS